MTPKNSKVLLFLQVFSILYK